MAPPLRSRVRAAGLSLAKSLGIRPDPNEGRMPARAGSDYILDSLMGSKAGRGMVVRSHELRNQVITPTYDPRYLMLLPLNEPLLFAGMSAIVTQVTKRGDGFKPRFVRKCRICGSTYEKELERCETAGCLGSVKGGTLVEPDPEQLGRIRRFLENPNPLRQWSDIKRHGLWRQVGCDLTTFEKVRADPTDPTSDVIELDSLPAERMRQRIGPKGLPGDPKEPFCPRCVREDPRESARTLPEGTSYCPRCGGATQLTAWVMLGPRWGEDTPVMRWAAHEIAWYQSRDGNSALVPLVDTVQLTISMRLWQRAAYTNGAPADRILTVQGYDKDTLDDQHDDVLAMREQNPRGNIELWMALPEGSRAEVVSLMPPMKDMLLTQVYDRLVTEIAADLGVSKEALGMQTAGQLGHPEEVLTVSLDTMEGHASQFDECFNGQIAPEFGVTDWVYELNRPDLKDEQREENLKTARLNRLLALKNAGFEVEITDEETMEFTIVTKKPAPVTVTRPEQAAPIRPSYMALPFLGSKRDDDER